jgi:hypothetical protein
VGRLLHNKIIHSENRGRQQKENAVIPVEKPSIGVPDRLTTEKLGKDKPIRVPTNGHL